MKSKRKQSELFSLIVLSIPQGRERKELERKFFRWFPHFDSDYLSIQLSNLPFTISDIPRPAASLISEELKKLGCMVEWQPVKKNDGSGEESSSSTRELPPLKPRASYKDFFSTTYLASFISSKNQSAEAFRTLRTNVQFLQKTRHLKKLIISSTNEGEGKSTVVSNLAIVMAQAGNNVLLVDADLRKPMMHSAFGAENTRGLSTILLGKHSYDECMQPSFVKNLTLLYSGPIPSNPSELLASERMGQLSDALAEKFDLVIFDTPPVSAVTDVIILTSHCDGIYLVIKSGVTDRKAVLFSIEQLKNVHAEILGIILNDFDVQNHYYYYKYYYSSYYDSNQGRNRGNTHRKKSFFRRLFS